MLDFNAPICFFEVLITKINGYILLWIFVDLRHVTTFFFLIKSCTSIENTCILLLSYTHELASKLLQTISDNHKHLTSQKSRSILLWTTLPNDLFTNGVYLPGASYNFSASEPQYFWLLKRFIYKKKSIVFYYFSKSRNFNFF